MRLLALEGSSDPESAHAQADQLLVEFINDEEITEAFNALGRWYA